MSALRARYILAACALSGLAVLPVLPDSGFWIMQLNYIGLYAIVVIGINLLTGIAGLTTLGQAAFVGIGAYVAAFWSLQGVSALSTLVIGLAITFAVAFILGTITLRMSGYYLPLATLAWGISFYFLFANIEGLGRFDGLNGIPNLSLVGFPFESGGQIYYLIWAFVLFFGWTATNLLDSRAGRALRALREGAVMPEAMGISTFRAKLSVFLLAALLASVSGWLFVYMQRSVSPSPFNLNMSITYVVMGIVGGVGTIWGAIAGAGLVQVLQERLQTWIPALIGSSGSYEVVAFGVLLIAVLKYAPEGLWPHIDRLFPVARPARPSATASKLPTRSKIAQGQPLLEVNSVYRRFGGLTAVGGVSFTVHAGEILGLIGPNGAGKSTLFSMISGALSLSDGEIRFDGTPLARRSARQIAELGIARTFQHVKIVPDMSVVDNVALGAHWRGRGGILSGLFRLRRGEERALLNEAFRQLDRVGLTALANEPAGSLALGQQRLVEVARALSSDPVLLLFDEPAAGLRPQEKKDLAALLYQLRGEGVTMLVVEHDMDFLMGLADQVVVMNFGVCLIDAKPDEVRRSPVVRAAYLGAE